MESTVNPQQRAVGLDSLATADSLPADGQAGRSIREQGSVLFALHNDLIQHQRSVSQAFASLDQACRALVAAVATSPPAGTPDCAAPTTAHRFAQLLRQVDALHQFLFTNLYVHQRECALHLLSGIERSVLATAAAPSPRASVGRAGSEGGQHRDNTGADAEHELRSQIAQLRYRLSSAAHPHFQNRLPPPLDVSPRASADASPHPPPSEAIAANSSGGAEEAPRPDASTAASSSTWAVAVGRADPAEVSFPTSAASLPPRAALRRHRLFALSSTFAAAGPGGQRGLSAMIGAVQGRFRIHAVVLCSGGRTASPQHEMELAVRLGCLFLVVPHIYRRAFAPPCPILIVSDREVMSYDQGRGGGPTGATPSPSGFSYAGHHDPSACGDTTHAHHAATASTEVAGGACGRLSDSDSEDDLMGSGGSTNATSLEQLFLSLEADMPTADTDTPWSPSFSQPDRTPVAAPLVVDRAELRRTQPRRPKRPRSDALSEHASSSTPHVSLSLPPSSDGLRGPFESFADCTLEDVEGEVNSLSQPHVMESQHIGFTQAGAPLLSAHTPPLADTADGGPATAAAADAGEGSGDEHRPLPPVFQISNSVKYLKPQLIEAIEQLGGVVDQSSGYSRACRYLIVAEGITERTEKYLGACAASAHIVPPRFVFDSQRRGYWLTNRVHEYDMSPQRVAAHQPRPPPIFRNWRVVLITCRTAAARGVRAALLAGGCLSATAFVVDLTAESPLGIGACAAELSEAQAVDGVVEGVCPSSVIARPTLDAATHILVECSSVTAQGFFQMPDWVPPCVRRPDYASRVFTLELLYFCLCSHPDRIFDPEGLLCDEEALTPACRVEPM